MVTGLGGGTVPLPPPLVCVRSCTSNKIKSFIYCLQQYRNNCVTFSCFYLTIRSIRYKGEGRGGGNPPPLLLFLFLQTHRNFQVRLPEGLMFKITLFELRYVAIVCFHSKNICRFLEFICKLPHCHI